MSPWTLATPRCESVPVSPCPGKCFAAVNMPCSFDPLINAATRLPTCTGSSPKERVLMMGLSGLLFTSATGNRFHCTPMARDSSAVIAPNLSAYAMLPVAPKAMASGKAGTELTREASPRSKSAAISKGSLESRWSWLATAATSRGGFLSRIGPSTWTVSTTEPMLYFCIWARNSW